MNGSADPRRIMAQLQAFSLESDRYVERVASKNGLHRTDLNALGYLSGSDRSGLKMTPGKLGEALHLSSPATTALVDRLSKAGHVNRSRSDSDRRQVEVSMTDHAREVGKGLFSPLGQHVGQALAKYSEEELAFISGFLADMTQATAAAKDSLKAPAPLPVLNEAPAPVEGL